MSALPKDNNSALPVLHFTLDNFIPIEPLVYLMERYLQSHNIEKARIAPIKAEDFKAWLDNTIEKNKTHTVTLLLESLALLNVNEKIFIPISINNAHFTLLAFMRTHDNKILGIYLDSYGNYHNTFLIIERFLDECKINGSLNKLTTQYQHNNDCAIQVYEAFKILTEATTEQFNVNHLQQQIKYLKLDQEEIATSKRLDFANEVVQEKSHFNSIYSNIVVDINPNNNSLTSNQLLSNSAQFFDTTLYTQTGYLKSFRIVEHNYNGLPGGFTWPKIPMFAVITGKNGVGKSSVFQAILYGILSGRQSQVKLDFTEKELPQICSLENTNELTTLRKDVEQQSIKLLENEQNTIFMDLKKYALSRLLSTNNYSPTRPDNIQFYDQLINDAISKEVHNRNFSFSTFEQELKNLFNEACAPHIAQYNSLPVIMNRIFDQLCKNPSQSNEKDKKSDALKILNSFLCQNNFKYIFSSESCSTNEFEIVLTFPPNFGFSNASKVRSSQLSSGERLHLLILMWRFEHRKSSKKSILLLDEPDAHLHPDIIADVIETIKTKLINELKIQVIMTTHNPITASLVPLECIYVLRNEPPHYKPKIAPVNNKKEAINILSGNLVYINEPFAVVFVEGQKDKLFYEMISSILNSTKLVTTQVIFKVYSMSEKSSLSSCSQIESLIEKMTSESSNEPLSQFVFGLIDDDNKEHKNVNSLKVLKRYSVENYIFDPVNLCLGLYYIVKQCENNNLFGDNLAKLLNSIKPHIPKLNDLFNSIHLILCTENPGIALFQIVQEIVNLIYAITKPEVQKAFNYRVNNYDALILMLDTMVTELDNIQSNSEKLATLPTSKIYELVKKIAKKPNDKNKLYKEFFASVRTDLENEIEKSNFDIFNIDSILIFDDDLNYLSEINNLIDAEKDRSKLPGKIAEIIKKHIISIKKIATNRKIADWNDIVNAHFSRKTKIMDNNHQIIWDDTESQEVYLILNNAREIKGNISYPRFFLYFRGHHLQTVYEKIFKIPHDLANDFSQILSNSNNLLITGDLVKIFLSMKSIIDKNEKSNYGEKLYSKAGSISFFNKLIEKDEQDKKREEANKKHQQAQIKQEKAGITDETLEQGLGFS